MLALILIIVYVYKNNKKSFPYFIRGLAFSFHSTVVHNTNYILFKQNYIFHTVKSPTKILFGLMVVEFLHLSFGRCGAGYEYRQWCDKLYFNDLVKLLYKSNNCMLYLYCKCS